MIKVLGSAEPRALDGNLVRAAWGAGVTLAGKLLGVAFRLVLAFVLARSLGAEQYGLYNLALTVAGLAASLAVLGLSTGLVRYISTLASRGDDEGLWGTIQVGVGIPALLSFLFGIAVFLLPSTIAEQMFHESRLVQLLPLASLVIPFLVLEEVLAGAIQGFKNMHYPVIASSICNPTVKLLALGAFIIVVGLNAQRAVLTFVLAEGAAALLLVYFLNKKFPLRRSLSRARRDFREMLAYSVPLQLSKIVVTFSGSLQVILLQTIVATSSVGIFAIASQINLLGGLMQSSLHTATNPLVAQLHDKDDRAQLRYLYQMASKWSLIFNLPCFLTVLLIPELLLSLLGRSYVDGAPALTILAWATLIETGTGISSGILDMTGHSRLRLVNSIAEGVAVVILSTLLIPRAGVFGAALAVLAATCVLNFLRLTQVFVLLRILPYNTSYLKPLSAGLLAFLVSLAMGRLLGGQGDVVRGVVQIMALVATYVGSILALGLTPDERMLLTRLLQRWRAA
ncbi:MAG: flippase [Chloroflexi bacterium]|nr:flippase [Chloroflexota bacterium]